MKKKGVCVFLILVVITLSYGCTIFTAPAGIWICDDLGIMIDFDQDEIKWGSITGKGTITVGGETKEIVCGMDPIGGADFLYVDEMDKHSSEINYLYNGTFRYIDENTMIYKIVRREEKYTFVKQASEVEDTTAGDGEIP